MWGILGSFEVSARNYLGSISAALSSLVRVPPRAFGWGARAPFPNSGWWSSLEITSYAHGVTLHAVQMRNGNRDLAQIMQGFGEFEMFT